MQFLDMFFLLKSSPHDKSERAVEYFFNPTLNSWTVSGINKIVFLLQTYLKLSSDGVKNSK